MKFEPMIMEISLATSSFSISADTFSSPKSLRKSAKVSSISCRATYNDTNFYKVLSLSSSNADIEEIKRAYRTLALKYHPDVCSPSMKEKCAKMFIVLNEAYRTLSDPVLRQEYNYGMMGFDKLENNLQMLFDGRAQFGRCGWEDQIAVLGKKSSERIGQKDGSWGARLRAKNEQNGAILHCDG